jgi:hypothetical protein
VNPLLIGLLLLAPPTPVAGVVFDDVNGDGRRDAGEAGLAGVPVTDGVAIVLSGEGGAYALAAAAEARRVFVVVPGDRRASSPWSQAPAQRLDFALAAAPLGGTWRFAQLSDTHVHAGNLGRMRQAFALAAGRNADFAVVSGDLVRDALRVGEDTAREYYSLFAAEAAKAPLPVLTAVGNHEVFGVERSRSGVAATHPAYGKGMYEQTLAPRYFAFNRGCVHFIVLDTVAVDDETYYGALDEAQLAWIRAELQYVPPGATVVTVGHIPLRTGELSTSFRDGSLITVGGETSYRHVVRNAAALAPLLQPFRWTLALQGHTHLAERLVMWDAASPRYHTAPAVDRQPWAPWLSGLFVYTVTGDSIDDGELLALDRE